MGELVGVVAAARLAALAAGDEQDRVVPVGEIRDKAHSRTMTRRGGARTVSSARLRLIGDAQEEFEQTGAADGMLHLKCIEFLPLPILDAGASCSRFERANRRVCGGDEQLVVTFEWRRKPFRRAIGKQLLQECSFAPAVEDDILA